MAPACEGEPLQKGTEHFDEILWPHLRAAYNFARWLVRNDHDAEDIVQESFLKAFLGAGEFRGRDPRAWLLAIVRNTAMNLLRRRRSDPAHSWRDEIPDPADHAADPEAALISESRRAQIHAAIGQLPDEFRETLVLRELEGLAYKEIASIVNVPVGTVMSRLSRARALLVEQLIEQKGCAQ
jgi:RNA polymerase sigma-70 factor (ECF subfamily)